MKYVAITQTKTDSLKYSRDLQQKGISCEVRPAPRVISKSCTPAVYIEYGENFRALITKEVYKLYRVNEKKQYALLYAPWQNN
ncbi:MAG: DUF3343 domain-containing protein [Clostridia bacterium]|jgi:hypothetical protein|nr:DUF3343 domain-containing protein [Clostridia bacterium]